MKQCNKVDLIRIFLICTGIIFSVGGCHQPVTKIFESEIDSITSIYAPDRREGIFEATISSAGTEKILKGETNIPEAKEALISLLEKKGIAFQDSLAVLPDTSEIIKSWGLVNVSVCNIRASVSYASELVSQALMGTPVRIIKKDGGWFLIQTPDRYLGWIDNDAIVPLSSDELNRWKSSERIFYTRKTGDIYAGQAKDKVISDIVAGCIVEIAGVYKDSYELILPDGRKGFITKSECISLDQLSEAKYPEPERLKSVAESFMGSPYLWGGTSAKGFDCSGFVKTVYFLNGIILSRDASLQFNNGIKIDKNGYPDSMMIGDLLFFGSVRDGIPRATHVGMYIGDTEFIHDAGMVRINSLDTTRINFSRYRRDSFLGAVRIRGAMTGSGIQRVPDHKWYK